MLRQLVSSVSFEHDHPEDPEETRPYHLLSKVLPHKALVAYLYYLKSTNCIHRICGNCGKRYLLSPPTKLSKCRNMMRYLSGICSKSCLDAADSQGWVSRQKTCHMCFPSP